MSESNEDAIVTTQRRAAIAIIWINRPDVLNAISLAVKAALIAAVEAADQDADIGAIVLAGIIASDPG